MNEIRPDSDSDSDHPVDEARRGPAHTLPTPRITRSRWPTLLIWLVPLAAVAALIFYGVKFSRQRGTEIAISFADASGLKLRDTFLAVHGVRVGDVSRIELDEDRARALVYVRVRQEYESTIARDGGKFWIVRPDIGGGMLTGLSTVISGPYIEVEPGQGDTAARFYGLDSRPVLLGDGLRVVLHTDRLSHVQIDSPVYFRGVQVGAVQDIRFSGDATGVNVTAFVWQRYARLLHRGSRFWYVSGTDIHGGLLSGINVEVNNVKALLAGGVAFATPADGSPPASDGANFTLHEEADKDWLKWSAPIELPPDDNPGQAAADKPGDTKVK